MAPRSGVPRGPVRELAGQLADGAERLTGAVATLDDCAAAEAGVESACAAAGQRAATAEAARAEAERRVATADRMRNAAAEAAERDLDAIRAELAQVRQETGAAGTPRRRQGRE